MGDPIFYNVGTVEAIEAMLPGNLSMDQIKAN